MIEPKDAVPDILRKMRREARIEFQSIRRELNDIRQALLMLTAAHVCVDVSDPDNLIVTLEKDETFFIRIVRRADTCPESA